MLKQNANNKLLRLVPEKLSIIVEAIPDASADISELAAAGIKQVPVKQGSWQMGKHAHANCHNSKGQCLLKTQSDEANFVL